MEEVPGISNYGLADEDCAISERMEKYITERDGGVCQICKLRTQTKRNPLVVEWKNPKVAGTVHPKDKNLWLVHLKCHENYQARLRYEELRLRPNEPPLRPGPIYVNAKRAQGKIRPVRKRWGWRQTVALIVLLIELVFCYWCYLFYKWCDRVFWQGGQN